MFSFFSKSNQNDIDISADEFRQRLESDSGVVIDVRTLNEYNEGHLKITDEQYNWLDGEFQNAAEEMDKNKTYYLYCRSGNRSGQAARFMKDKGFEKAYNVGGYDALVRSGFESD